MDQYVNDPSTPTPLGTTATDPDVVLAPTTVPVTGSAEQSSGTTGTATEKGKEVAHVAAGQAKDVAAEARSQVGSVTGEAVQQAKQVVSTAGSEVQNQLGDRLGAASVTARDTAGQLRALAEGRVEDAGPVGDFARVAGDHLERLANRADDLGVQGVIDEVTDFARRRPVAFLVGAATAGFLVSRVARAGKDAAADDDRRATTDRSAVVDLTDPARVGSGAYDPVPAPVLPAGSAMPGTGAGMPVGGTYGEVR